MDQHRGGDTDRISLAVLSGFAAERRGDDSGRTFADQVAEKLTDKVVERAKKKQSPLVWALAALLGTGGGVGGYYATEAQAKANAEQIEKNSARVDRNDARLAGAEKSIGEVSTAVKQIASAQKSIAAGVEELKRENIEKLKSDLKDARRELRRRRR